MLLNMNAKIKITIYIAATILYMALILFLSIWDTTDVATRWHIDKFMHVGAYGVMGLLGYRTLIRVWRSLMGFKAAVVVFVSSTLFGVFIEFYQGMTGYRVFSYGDMAANAVGALIGVIIASYFALERSKDYDLR